jgi:hypothetical protein
MESKREKKRFYGHAKITKIAAYKRKKLIQHNKNWIITIGMLAVMASTAIYFGDAITQFLGNQVIHSNVNVMMYSSY